MLPRQLTAGLALTLLVGGLLAVPVPRPEPPDFRKLTPEAIKQWSGSEVLVVGKLTNVLAGPVGLSEPPLRTYRLEVAIDKVLRGPAKLAKTLPANYAVRQSAEPVFPEGECVIALKFVRKAWEVHAFAPATPHAIEQAKLAVTFPLGWTIQGGKLVSPWAKLGKPGKSEGIACSVSGRSVLLAGPVRFEAEPVPPTKKLEFKNPDGDGQYKLTVTNDSDQEIEVPALLTDGKTILWNESVVVIIQGKAYAFPNATGQVAGLKSVVLKPGESVSGVINALVFKGPEWPRGGSRVEFQFCLGERSVTESFYYYSSHHDPIRAAAIQALK